MIVYFKGKCIDLDNDQSDILEGWTFCRVKNGPIKSIFGYNKNLYMSFNELDNPTNITHNVYQSNISSGIADKSYILIDIGDIKFKDKIAKMINDYIR